VDEHRRRHPSTKSLMFPMVESLGSSGIGGTQCTRARVRPGRRECLDYRLLESSSGNPTCCCTKLLECSRAAARQRLFDYQRTNAGCSYDDDRTFPGNVTAP